MTQLRYDPWVDRDLLFDRLRSVLAEAEPPVAAAWLFGSRARGEDREDSDVDVAVLLLAPAGRTLEALPGDLQARLTAAAGAEVDLVVVDHAPVDLVHRVLRDGVVLIDRAPSARIAFEVRKRNEYFDLLPYLREYRRAVLERAG